MIRLRVADGCSESRDILLSMLRDRGMEVEVGAENPKAMICWGFGYRGRDTYPILNQNAGGLNKLEELTRLRSTGLLVPNFHVPPLHANFPRYLAPNESFPLYGRSLRHEGGRDILPVFDKTSLAYAERRGCDFYTQFIPNTREFRVWVYRLQHLATYEKLLKEPAKYKGLGRRCMGDGFQMRLLQEGRSVNDTLTEVAIRSVEALQLDFGAVDVILGEDLQHYVLEVNTAPGLESRERLATIRLANKMARWVEDGHPSRSGGI